MEKFELKELLTTIKDNNYQPPSSIDMSTLTHTMLDEIGNVDPVLRDNLIYDTFSSLIINDFYSEMQLKRYFEVCLDEAHLFYRLGEENTDSVFTRSFSSLIIAAILHVTSSELEKTSELLLNYLGKENDVRGYVDKKGWAHSIAHIADALAELAVQTALPPSEFKAIFHSIIDKMCYRKDTFQYEEDERMVITVLALY